MPKRRVKERRKTAREFKRLVQVHGGRKKQAAALHEDQSREERRDRP